MDGVCVDYESNWEEVGPLQESMVGVDPVWSEQREIVYEECDRFMLCMVHKLGYGNWDELKAAFRTSPLFRFDWFVKSRTTQELARRCDALIRLVERENQEFDERERQARKEKKLAKNMTPTKRSLVRQATEISPTLKKRKQSSMDDYVSSGKRKK